MKTIKRNVLSLKHLATMMVAFSPALAGVGCIAEPAESDEGTVGAAESALTYQELQDSFLNACQSATPVQAGFTNTSGNCTVLNFTRTAVDATAAIYEYTADVAIGAGPNNVIRLHRTVREASLYTPAASDAAVMLVHGDIWSSGTAFGDSGFAKYLASQGVDVWSVDLRWTLIPNSPLPNGDSSFMANWGMAQQADDLGVALSIARWNRNATGSIIAPMSLLGWSRGGQLGYAYLDKETLVPIGQRHVNGFIPVDIYLRTAPNSAEQTAACNRLTQLTTQYGTGEYYSILAPGYPLGKGIGDMGTLAVVNASGSSPFNPPLTNRQFALLAGEATFQLQTPNQVTPFYHFTGGTFDANSLPNGTTYTLESNWFNFMTKAAWYQPIQMMIDAEKAGCGNGTSTIDTHFADIKVPVHYVGADGGFGSSGIYTMSALGSQDKSSHIVDLVNGDQLSDFGHGDIFLAQDAQTQVWEDVHTWVTSAECFSDADCAIVRDNNTCQCLGVQVGTPAPKSRSACYIDPCLNKVAACQNRVCVAVSTSM